MRSTACHVQEGFTLLEILIVIGIMGSIVAMMLLFRTPNMEGRRDAMLLSLTNMVSLARQEAQKTRDLHRLTFSKTKGGFVQIRLERQEVTVAPDGTKAISFVDSDFGEISSYEFIEGSELKAFFVDGVDQVSAERPDLSLYLEPDALVPSLFVQMRLPAKKGKDDVTLTIEPFLGEWKLKSGFEKPAKKKRS